MLNVVSVESGFVSWLLCSLSCSGIAEQTNIAVPSGGSSGSQLQPVLSSAIENGPA